MRPRVGSASQSTVALSAGMQSASMLPLATCTALTQRWPPKTQAELTDNKWSRSWPGGPPGSARSWSFCDRRGPPHDGRPSPLALGVSPDSTVLPSERNVGLGRTRPLPIVAGEARRS